MKRPQKDPRVHRSLFSVWTFLTYFVLVCILVTTSFLIFFGGLNMELTQAEIRVMATRVFLNVILMSLICTLVDGIYKKITIERPVRRILEATHKVTQGDFSVRVQPIHPAKSKNELDVLIEDINVMTQELSGTETLRTDFVSNVSHELKTPLAVIQNYAQMLQDPQLTEAERLEYAEKITSATHSLSDLITNVLRLNKLENQQIYPQPSTYDLSEQLRTCLLHFESAWEKKSLQMYIDLEDSVMVHSDAELMRLVWNNLISNAVKFTGEGGRIRVALHTEGSAIYVDVQDTGCGISSENGHHIFEKFYQGDTSHATEGNGLGLALVKRVIDIVGAEISVESEVGKGSSFTVKLQIT